MVNILCFQITDIFFMNFATIILFLSTTFTHTHDPRHLPTTHDPRHLATLHCVSLILRPVVYVKSCPFTCKFAVMKGYARNDNFTVLIRRLLTCLMRPDFRITIPLETIPTSFSHVQN